MPAFGLFAGPTIAETLRIATWNVGLDRTGPGLLVKDLLAGDDAQLVAIARVIQALDADVLLLTAIDYDRQGVALDFLAQSLGGLAYPHRFAFRPNTGMQTGFDVDGNGWIGDPRDAQGFGLFSGHGGMAVLSRLPVDAAGARDFSAFLWRDLPGAMLPKGIEPGLVEVQRLATTGFWDVPILTKAGLLHLLAWHATPPVFDGPEDRNGRRNHDEAAFWALFLAGALPMQPLDAPFVLLGDGNLDPMDGDGLRGGMAALLSDPALQDLAPKGTHGRSEPDQTGDPALDTAVYDDLGGLRLDYVLPSQGLTVTGAGVLWPAADDPLWPDLQAASHHFPVWVDITLP